MTPPPNPLPCGCRADRIEVIDCESGSVTYQQHVVVHCPLHAAAGQLLDVCNELVESASYWSEYDVPIGVVDRIRAVIAKAEGRT